MSFSASLLRKLVVMQRMEAGVEQEQLQQEAELNQEVNEEEVRTSKTGRSFGN